MTIDNSSLTPESFPYIAPDDYILVHDAAYNSPRNRRIREREMQKLLVGLCTDYVLIDKQSPEQEVVGRKIALGAAALIQLGSSEDKEPTTDRVSRQLNEVLPFIGAIQDPPVYPDPVTVEQVAGWMEDANANLVGRGRSQPYDITAWTYYSRIQGIESGSLVFADRIA